MGKRNALGERPMNTLLAAKSHDSVQGSEESDDQNIRIVPMEKEHARGAVEMHLLAFRGFFLASLGRGFLHQFYRAAAGHKETVGFVALRGGEVIGACFGLVNARDFYSQLLKKRWWIFGLYCIGPVLRRPGIIPRLLRARKHESHPPSLSIHPLGALQSTAVHPSCQGKGVAIGLMRAVCHEYARRGVHAVYLTTDADRNEMVRGFYKAMGWKFIGYYTTPEGRRMCWYLWLDPALRWNSESIPSPKE